MSKFWNFKNLSPNEGELQMYGPISSDSWWGDEITPKQFADDLKALGNVSDIHVHINSGGGDVFAGQTIYALLKSHKANIIVHVDGLAASIASVIAMAADKLCMHAGSMLMIHNPWSSVWGGDAEEMRQTADILDKIRDSLVAVYRQKCGKTDEEIKALMDAETWMTAQEAVDMGFADEIEFAIPVAASLKDRQLVMNGQTFDLSRFRNGPKNIVKEGNAKMPIEVKDVLKKLTPEEQQAVQAAQDLAVTNATTARDATELELKNQITTLTEANAILEKSVNAKVTGEQTDEQFLASLDPKVKDMIVAERAKSASALQELEAANAAKELDTYKAAVGKFDKLPMNAEEFAPIFQNMAKADKAGYDKLAALLTAANNCVDKGLLFAAVGQGQNNAVVSAYDELDAKAKELVVKDKLTYAKAFVKACKDNSELYQNYLKEMEGNE